MQNKLFGVTSLHEFKSFIEEWITNLRTKRKVKRLTKMYPDYADDEYNSGDLKFIWGVKSRDDLSKSSVANMYTLNDATIVYNRRDKTYSLLIETAYWFDTKIDEVNYLENLLAKFREFMITNRYDTNFPYRFWMSPATANMLADTIPELYTEFRIFVEGYKVLYKINDNDKSLGVNV